METVKPFIGVNKKDVVFRSLLIVGFCICCLGVIIIVALPPIFKFVLDDAIADGINDRIVINSNKAEDYEGWAVYNDREAPYYSTWWFWNLTNPMAVTNSSAEKPNYSRVGPYVWRRYRTKENINFSADGSSATYNSFVTFEYQPALSGANLNPQTDLITNVNPAYFAIINEAPRGELGLGLAISQQASFQIIEGMKAFFNSSAYLSLSYIRVLAASYQATVTSLLTNGHAATPQQAAAIFFENWANSTTTATNYTGVVWDGLLVSVPFGVPSTIDISIASRLFDPNTTFSFFDQIHPTIWSPLLSSANSTYFNLLKSTFGLTDTQMGMIQSWLAGSFATIRTTPALLQTFGVPTLSDLAYVQWGQATPLNNASIATVFAAQGALSPFAPGVPEIALAPGIILSPVTVPYNVSKILLSGPLGVTKNLTFLEQFLSLAEVGGDLTPWGVDSVTLGAQIASYFVDYLVRTYATAFISPVFAAGGASITTRTPQVMLFDCHDPLIAALNITGFNQSCSFRTNNTYDPPNSVTVLTGAANIVNISDYTVYDGKTQVDYYAQPLPVCCQSIDGQFAPITDNEGRRDQMYVWDADFQRPLKLKYDGNEVNQYDITVNRFYIDYDSQYGANPYYFQSVPGLANVSAANSGSPIFGSNWNFNGVAPNISTDLLTGVTTYNNDTEVSMTWVEPETGKVMKYQKTGQINVWIVNGTTNERLSVWNKMFKDGVIYPIAQLQDTQQLSEGQADEYKSLVSRARNAQKGLFWASIAVGICLLLCCTVVCIAGVIGTLSQRGWRVDRIVKDDSF